MKTKHLFFSAILCGCALGSLQAADSGAPLAWGRGFSGELGDGIFHRTAPFAVHTAGPVVGLPLVVQLTGGINHSLALRSDGAVFEWGAYGGFLSLNSAIPVQVPTLSGIVMIDAGEGHSLALGADGRVRGWGRGFDGQLGDGAAVNRNGPVLASGLANVVAIAGGGAHSLALKSDGTVWAWGSNTRSGVASGQLGDGTSNARFVPVPVGGGLNSVIAISAGDFHSVALKADGTVWTWGYGALGQMGNGLANDANPLPIQLPNLNTVVAIAAGSFHNLILKADGTVWAFGRSNFGQLGNGSFIAGTGLVPVQAIGVSNIRAIAAGQAHSLALAADGTVWAWGSGDFGELGNGKFYTSNDGLGSAVPVRATGVPAVQAIAAGNRHSLAIGIANQPPVARCQNVTVSAGADCAASASIDHGSHDPDADDSISITQTPPGPYSVGRTTVTLTATDGHGASSSCEAIVTVVDDTAPEIVCAPDVIRLTDAGSCFATVSLPFPAASDSCGVVFLSNDAPTHFPKGTTTVTWTARDLNNNTASCAQKVNVADGELPTIACPADIIASADPGQCFASGLDLGLPTIGDNCGIRSVTHDAPEQFSKGITVVTWTVEDTSGNIAHCAQNITVRDDEAPAIICPPDIVMDGNIPGSCGANVELGIPTVSDNCPGAAYSGIRSDNRTLTEPFETGVTTVTWTATDETGNATSCQQTITIQNTAPVVSLTSPASGAIFAVGTPIVFTGGFNPATGGGHSAQWKLGPVTKPGSIDEAAGTVTTTHTFASAGVYFVSLAVMDACGQIGSADSVDGLAAMVVVYDPNGGFVTGGGWFNSPGGAFPAQPSLTGKANFGFVSRYHKGASVPTGDTEFQFKAGNLSFSSTSYEWLVVVGAKAQYKGFGEINGVSGYRFILTGIDGSLPGGGGSDKMRVKIWDDNSSVIIYDNKIGSPDGDDPSTVVQGGNIVIHK